MLAAMGDSAAGEVFYSGSVMGEQWKTNGKSHWKPQLHRSYPAVASGCMRNRFDVCDVS